MKKKMMAIGECMAELRGDPTGLYELGYAGDCFNTAYYFQMASAENWDTQFYSAVGTDAISNKMLEFIELSKVDTSKVRRLDGMSVGLYLIQLSEGERSFTYWRGTSAARKMIDEVTLTAALADADLIYLSGITVAILDETSRVILAAALEDARSAGKHIAFDPNLRPSLWSDTASMRFWIRQMAGRASFVLPSFDDEQANFGDQEPWRTAERYQGYGATHIVVKNGEKPVYCVMDGVHSQIEVPQAVAVIDTTSAGDSFNGAYLAQIMHSKTVLEAVKFASAVAATVIGEHGAIVPVSRFSGCLLSNNF